MAAALITLGGTAEAKLSCKTRACLKRTCISTACKHRVEWKHYRRHPMPRCTWWGESGGSYRARNPHSTAGGKYQLLDGTFHGVGGPDYPGTHDAAQAPPLIQERLARRVLATQGLDAWVLC